MLVGPPLADKDQGGRLRRAQRAARRCGIPWVDRMMLRATGPHLTPTTHQARAPQATGPADPATMGGGAAPERGAGPRVADPWPG